MCVVWQKKWKALGQTLKNEASWSIRFSTSSVPACAVSMLTLDHGYQHNIHLAAIVHAFIRHAEVSRK